MKKESKPTKTSGAGTKPKKAAKKGASNGRDKRGKFKKGHKVNEKWTEATVLPILQAMWKDLTTDVDGNPPADRNVVRANDIKLLGEICLMHSVSKQRWNEWEDKFGPYIGEDKTPNPNFSESITDLLKSIKWILECRLNYSGGTMDIFILKAHYDYRDKVNIDHTTKEESINNPFYELLKATSAAQSK